MFFLWELKEDGMVALKHIPGHENEADIFTKNVDASTLHKHVAKFCGKDNFLDQLQSSKPWSKGGCERVFGCYASTVYYVLLFEFITVYI